MLWLIEQRAGQELQRAIKALPPLTNEQASALLGEVNAGPASERVMSVAEGVATIRVHGVLVPGVSLESYFYFGGRTRYGDIREALAVAADAPEVKRVVLDIDSPGGRVDGLFETLEAIKLFRKPMSVRASCACSAAYAIAAAAGGKIEAATEASEFGSVGVVTTYYFWAAETVVDITSTEAPDKRPDVTTEEGKAVVRKHLDAIHDLFVEAIAEGRNVKKSDVNANFGRGAVMLAREAKASGLIDGLPTKRRRPAGTRAEAPATSPSAGPSAEVTEQNDPAAPAAAEPPPEAEDHDQDPPSAGPDKMENPMNAEELKAQHPAVYNAIFEAGQKNGSESALAAERDRVGAHIEMGKASGDMDTALEAIENGTEMSQKLMAKYSAAGMNRAATAARQTESDAANAAADGAPEGDGAPGASTEPEGDLGDRIVAAMKEKPSFLRRKA